MRPSLSGAGPSWSPTSAEPTGRIPGRPPRPRQGGQPPPAARRSPRAEDREPGRDRAGGRHRSKRLRLARRLLDHHEVPRQRGLNQPSHHRGNAAARGDASPEPGSRRRDGGPAPIGHAYHAHSTTSRSGLEWSRADSHPWARGRGGYSASSGARRRDQTRCNYTRRASIVAGGCGRCPVGRAVGIGGKRQLRDGDRRQCAHMA